MDSLDDVKQEIADLKAQVLEVDTAVEGLHDQIKQLTGDGITPEAAQSLLTQLAEVKSALDKVPTDDEADAPPPEEA